MSFKTALKTVKRRWSTPCLKRSASKSRMISSFDVSRRDNLVSSFLGFVFYLYRYTQAKRDERFRRSIHAALTFGRQCCSGFLQNTTPLPSSTSTLRSVTSKHANIVYTLPASRRSQRWSCTTYIHTRPLPSLRIRFSRQRSK